MESLLIITVVRAADSYVLASGNVWDATVIWTHITLRPGLRQKPSSNLLLLTTVIIIIYSTTKSSCKLTVNSFKLSDLLQLSTKHYFVSQELGDSGMDFNRKLATVR